MANLARKGHACYAATCRCGPAIILASYALAPCQDCHRQFKLR